MHKKLPALLLGAVLALTPASVFAAERGRDGNSGAGGRVEHGFVNRGRVEHEHHVDRDRGYRGGFYYRGPGFSFGYYNVPYGYAYAPYYYRPDACGYYDQFGTPLRTAINQFSCCSIARWPATWPALIF